MHTEIIRSTWNELDRLEEDINQWDRDKTGYMDKNDLYTILRACRLPIDKELINFMLDRYVML